MNLVPNAVKDVNPFLDLLENSVNFPLELSTRTHGRTRDVDFRNELPKNKKLADWNGRADEQSDWFNPSRVSLVSYVCTGIGFKEDDRLRRHKRQSV